MALNLIGAVLPMGLSLITIPVYLGLLGDARYGVLAVAWLLLGYFGVFDLGLGRATAQRIASLDQQFTKLRSSVFWTALAMNASLGIVGGLVIWPVAVYSFSHYFSVDTVLRPEIKAAIPWLSLAVPLATISGVFSGALQGRAKFFELNLISVLVSILIQLLPLAVAWLHGPDLAWIIPAVILVRVLSLLLLFNCCRVHVFGHDAPVLSRPDAKALLQFGGWVTLTSLVGPMMVILDRFVIGVMLGAKVVTYYTVPFQLAERTSLIPGALTSALFPRLAAANVAEADRLAIAAMRSLAVLVTPIILLAILFIQPFLHWWITPFFASQASLSGQILLLGFWINGFAGIPYSRLQASGRPDIVSKCHLGEVIPYLFLLYIGLHYFKLPGAAVVFSMRALADCLLLLWFSGDLRSAIKILIMPAIMLLTGLGITIIALTGGMIWWMLSGVLLLCSVVWSWQNMPLDLQSIATGLMQKVIASQLEKVRRA